MICPIASCACVKHILLSYFLLNYEIHFQVLLLGTTGNIELSESTSCPLQNHWEVDEDSKLLVSPVTLSEHTNQCSGSDRWISETSLSPRRVL